MNDLTSFNVAYNREAIGRPEAPCNKDIFSRIMSGPSDRPVGTRIYYIICLGEILGDESISIGFLTVNIGCLSWMRRIAFPCACEFKLF